MEYKIMLKCILILTLLLISFYFSIKCLSCFPDFHFKKLFWYKLFYCSTNQIHVLAIHQLIINSYIHVHVFILLIKVPQNQMFFKIFSCISLNSYFYTFLNEDRLWVLNIIFYHIYIQNCIFKVSLKLFVSNLSIN